MPQPPSPRAVTQLLSAWRGGDESALDELMPLVYEELRRLADGYLRRERPNHTLQPTALVHEAYLRLVDQRGATWQGRAHFVNVAARVMRHVLVDHARGRLTSKRGSGLVLLSLDEAVSFFEQRDVSLIALDEALGRLARKDEQQARVVELRFFGGLDIREVAEALNVSTATVSREWETAKLWLLRELSRG